MRHAWGRGRSVYGILIRKSEDLSVGGRITLRWILGRLGSVGKSGFGWLRIGSSGGIL
jgi:hypothetical protein